MRLLLPLLLAICKDAHAFAPLYSSTFSSQSSKTTERIEKEILDIQQQKEKEARASHNNEIFNALFVSVEERKEPTLIHDVMNRPKDFPPGAFLRLGPNGGSPSDGFLDGDGMLHCVSIPPDTDAPLSYSCSYIETRGRQLEESKGKKFIGSLGSAPKGLPLLLSVLQNMINFQVGTKDTCNTAIAQSGSRILTTMEQSPPSEILIGKDGIIQTIQSKTNLNNAIPSNDPVTGGNFGAHGKTCPTTNERIHVSYGSASKPFARVDIFQENWEIIKSIPINDIQSPVMIHDCAITPNHIVILDFPLTINPLRMFHNQFPVEYDAQNGARIGLLSRHDSSIQWFETKPGVILHTVNAYQEDEKVILHALRSEPSESSSYISSYSTAFLHEWVMDLRSGRIVKEQCLNAEELVEFPIIDDRFVSMQVKDCYCVGVKSIGGPLTVYNTPQEGILLDRVLKFALVDDASNGIKRGDVIGQFIFPSGYWGVTEPTVVPKVGDGSDGCYVIVAGTKVPEKGIKIEEMTSRLFVLDGDNLDVGAVWEFDLPYRIPYGLHSGFVPWESLC